MDQFKVDIRFPRGENPNQVLVTGTQEHCEACVEHLLVLEEEYVSFYLSKCCSLHYPPCAGFRLRIFEISEALSLKKNERFWP